MSGMSVSVTMAWNTRAARQQEQRVASRTGGGDAKSAGREQRRQHVAEEQPVVDEQHRESADDAARQRVRTRHLHEMRDVDDLDHRVGDPRRTDHAGRAAGDLDVEEVLDDVEDLVDHEADALAADAEHQHRVVGGARRSRRDPSSVEQRHQEAAVLHDQHAVGDADRAGGGFDARDQRQRHDLERARRRRGTAPAGSSRAAARSARGRAGRRAPGFGCEADRARQARRDRGSAPPSRRRGSCGPRT